MVLPISYSCRFARKPNAPTSLKDTKSDRKATRRDYESTKCPFWIKCLYFDQSDHIELYITSKATCHTHGLETSDQYRQNSISKRVAKQEISKGYTPSTITNAICRIGQSEGHTNLEVMTQELRSEAYTDLAKERDLAALNSG